MFIEAGPELASIKEKNTRIEVCPIYLLVNSTSPEALYRMSLFLNIQQRLEPLLSTTLNPDSH